MLLAFYLQIGIRYSPLQAGLGIIPIDVTFLISNLISGILSDVYGSRILTTTGIALQTIGFLVLSTFGTTTDYFQVALVLCIFGVGNGLFNAPNTREIMGSVPPNRRGIASGFRSLVYNAGLAISYGFVILFVTLGIPYGTLSKLLQGTEPQPGLAFATTQFLNGFRMASLIFAVIIAFAILPSVMRGKRGEIPLIEEIK